MRKDTKKSVDNFEFVFDTLFPDGKIPSFKEIQEKTNAGTLTYRDAMIAKLYSNGSQAIDALTKPEGAAFKSIEKTNPKVIQKAESFYSVFGAAKNPQLMSGIRSDITKFSNKFQNALDTPFTEIRQAVAGGSKGLKPLQGDVSVFDKVFTNIKAGKSVEGMKVGGTRIFNSIPDEQALKELLSGIKKIPDDELRQATYLALIGYRGTALQGMSASLEAATEGEDIFPYFDTETEQIVKPDVKKPGKKPLPPTSKPGPVAVDTLKFRMANASEFGELFPNVSRDQIAAALNEHVYPNLSESTVKKLGRMPSGYTDMRRFFASAVANLLGDVKQASVLIGHTAGAESLEGEIDKVLTNHYARLTQANASAQDVRHKTLFAYESILARLLGKKTSNDLAQFLGLPFEEGVTATYTDDVDLLTGDAKTSVRTDKQSETPEAAAARNAKNIALDEEITIASRTAAADSQIELQEKTSIAAAGAEQFVEDTKVSAAAKAEAEQIESEARTGAKKDKAVERGKSHRMALRSLNAKKGIIDPSTLKSSMLAAATTGLGIVKSVPGPLLDLVGGVLDKESYDIAQEKGERFASELTGQPEDSFVSRMGGGAGVVGEMVTGAVADPQGAMNLGQQAASLFGPMRVQPQTNITIPDPVPTEQGNLEAEGFKKDVNTARSQAMKNEPTSMGELMARGGKIPSFLYGGIVR